MHLQGLVPDGVYSMFYTTLGPDSANPLCPNAMRDVALTSIVPESQQPDASSFVASRRGGALYVGRVDGDLLAADQVSVKVVYHADGQTYGDVPNRRAFETQGETCTSSYGVDAMRQLFILQKWIF